MARLNLPVASLNVGDPEKVEQESFAIGNLAVILHLLRSKMYSNPIRTIVQEISSNARDANREVGNGDKPIVIKLPTKFEPELWIQDFGPGITPKRMSGVYLQYGNSTKRESDEETGCFGLGAKSPFSYVTSFGIETITPEPDGTHKLRVYIATIDEKQIGKVLKCNELETTEPCGTTVKIPVKPKDIYEFQRWTNLTLNRWNPLPKVNVEDVFDKVKEPDIKGEDWEIDIDSDRGFTYYEDQIPYHVDAGNFERIPEHLIPLFTRVALNIFGKGKVLVTGNRESLDYQPEVQQYLIEKLEEIYKDCNEKLTTKVASCTTLWDAMCVVHQQEEAWGFKILQDVLWHGEKVPSPDHVSFDGTTMYTVEGDSSKTHGIKIKRRSYETFSPRRSNMIIQNHNEGRPNPAYVSKAYAFAKDHFEALNITSWSLFILSVHDWQRAQPQMDKVRYPEWGVQSLEDFKPERKPRQKRDGTYERSPIVKVRQFNTISSDWNNYERTWDKTEIDLMDADGGVYVPLHSRQIDEKDVTTSHLHVFCKRSSNPVFGIPRRFTNKGLGPQWIPFKEAASKFLDELIQKHGNTFYRSSSNSSPYDVLNCEIRDVLDGLIKTGQVNGKLGNWFKVAQESSIQAIMWEIAGVCGRTSELTFKSFTSAEVKEIGQIFPLLFMWDGCRYNSDNYVKGRNAVLKEFIVRYVKEQEDAEAAREKAKADEEVANIKRQPYYGILKPVD